MLSIYFWDEKKPLQEFLFLGSLGFYSKNAYMSSMVVTVSGWEYPKIYIHISAIFLLPVAT